MPTILYIIYQRGAESATPKGATLAYWLLELKFLKKQPVIFLCPLKAGNKSPMWKAPSLDQEGRQQPCYQRHRMQGQESCVNKPPHYLSNLPPQAQTYSTCPFFTNVVLFCLKVMKAACFGQVFETHILMSIHVGHSVVSDSSRPHGL